MQGARAIADPVRREILELLHATPLPAGTIAEHFAISRPAVSKHLRILTECGVVEVTTAGRQRIYALRTEPLSEVAAYLDRLLGPALPGRLDALATEVARTRRERRSAQTRPDAETKERQHDHPPSDWSACARRRRTRPGDHPHPAGIGRGLVGQHQ